jgi:transposase, IS30 family
MKHLTKEQRHTISVMSQGNTQEAIASLIGVSKSTISRELKRNSDKRSGQYDCNLAQRKYENRQKHKKLKEVFTPVMKAKAKELLILGFSPEQITGRIRFLEEAMVSHETIYRWIWSDKRKKGVLHSYLRRQGRKYSKRGSLKNSRGIITNRIDIDLRPAIVNQKKRFGDLEIDTIIGKNHKGAIVTINDRVTGKVWIRKLTGKEASPLAQKTIEILRPIRKLIHTITADNGKEFAKHKEIAEQLKIDFYFCKPYHSWERGANENTNGLIRQYIPKKTDFSTITDEFILMVEEKLNNRPRKRLKYFTPNEKFNLLTKLNPVAFVS